MRWQWWFRPAPEPCPPPGAPAADSCRGSPHRRRKRPRRGHPLFRRASAAALAAGERGPQLRRGKIPGRVPVKIHSSEIDGPYAQGKGEHCSHPFGRSPHHEGGPTVDRDVVRLQQIPDQNGGTGDRRIHAGPHYQGQLQVFDPGRNFIGRADHAAVSGRRHHGDPRSTDLQGSDAQLTDSKRFQRMVLRSGKQLLRPAMVLIHSGLTRAPNCPATSGSECCSNSSDKQFRAMDAASTLRPRFQQPVHSMHPGSRKRQPKAHLPRAPKTSRILKPLRAWGCPATAVLGRFSAETGVTMLGELTAPAGA